jgi:hypothetical protein
MVLSNLLFFSIVKDKVSRRGVGVEWGAVIKTEYSEATGIP